MFKLLSAACLLVHTYVFAEPPTHDTLLHFTAHVGASYMINSIAYGAYTKGLGLNHAPGEWAAFGTTMAIGLGYKLLEGDRGGIPVSMAQNAFGALLSVASHVTFSW